MIFCGQSGVGKTTVAKAIARQLNAECLVVNASLNRNIDTLRNEVFEFCSTFSLDGSQKIVLLDEADYLNQQSFQPALRAFMEEMSENVTFILTCNAANRLIDPILSRCALFHFSIPSDEKTKICGKIAKRLRYILQEEKIEYNPKLLGELILAYYPDMRAMINAIQKHSIDNVLQLNAIDRKTDNMDQLIESIVNKNFANARVWINEHPDIDYVEIYSHLYERMVEKATSSNDKAQVIIIMAKYQFQAPSVVDLELNFAACLAELMSQCNFK